MYDDDKKWAFSILLGVGVNPSSDEDVNCWSEDFDPYFNVDEEFPGYCKVEIDSDTYLIFDEDGGCSALEDRLLSDDLLLMYSAETLCNYTPNGVTVEMIQATKESSKVTTLDLKNLIGNDWQRFVEDMLHVDGEGEALGLEDFKGEFIFDNTLYWVFKT